MTENVGIHGEVQTYRSDAGVNRLIELTWKDETMVKMVPCLNDFLCMKVNRRLALEF